MQPLSSPPSIAALLLAAGQSRRFGADKRAALLDGRPLLELTIERWLGALASRAPLTVVLRQDDEAELLDRVRGMGAQVLRARGSERGLGSSLAAAVQALPPGTAMLVGLADMPFVQRETLALVAARLAQGASLVAPFYRGSRGHPVGFGPAWRERLSGLDGDRGAGALLAGAPLERLEVDDPGILEDIDTPAQLPASATGPRASPF